MERERHTLEYTMYVWLLSYRIIFYEVQYIRQGARVNKRRVFNEVG